MKKLILCLCIMLWLSGFSIQVQAFEPEISDFEKEELASLLAIDSEDILSVEVVYDFYDEPSFLLVDTVPGGYAIVFREFGVISERSAGKEAVNPYGTLDGIKYYAGPMNYFICTDIVAVLSKGRKRS